MREREAFERIASKLSERKLPAKIAPLGFASNRSPHVIGLERFSSLSPGREEDVVYVDGGQGVLLRSSSDLVGLVRLAAVCYAGRVREWHRVVDVIVHVRHDNSDSCYTVEGVVVGGGPFIIPIFEPIVVHTDKLVMDVLPTEYVLSLVRKCYEYSFAAQCCDSGVLVLDGSFDTKSTYERKALEQLFVHCAEEEVVIGGLAKSTSMLTSAGLPLPSVLMEKQPEGMWCYGPLCEHASSGVQEYMVRLHPRSRFCFRLDVRPEFVGKVVSTLLPVSHDPVFLGYPYGLVEADNLARVSNKDVEKAKIRLQSVLGGKRILDLEMSSAAHGVLDSIRF